MKSIAALAALFALLGCDNRPGPPPEGRESLSEQTIEGGTGTTIRAEIWADNWFAMAINGAPLAEDSVAYKTERSFNAERITFRAELPITVAIEWRDFIENDTGLEYIGSNRQQIGDGGAIAQFFDAETGDLLAASDASWKCLVVHHAPIDTACVDETDPVAGQGACAARITPAPAGWQQPGFDDSAWSPATIHTASAVSPKFGYDEIEWAADAKLIWSPDLKIDNHVLCRTTIEG